MTLEEVKGLEEARRIDEGSVKKRTWFERGGFAHNCPVCLAFIRYSFVPSIYLLNDWTDPQGRDHDYCGQY